MTSSLVGAAAAAAAAGPLERKGVKVLAAGLGAAVYAIATGNIKLVMFVVWAASALGSTLIFIFSLPLPAGFEFDFEVDALDLDCIVAVDAGGCLVAAVFRFLVAGFAFVEEVFAKIVV